MSDISSSAKKQNLPSETSQNASIIPDSEYILTSKLLKLDKVLNDIASGRKYPPGDPSSYIGKPLVKVKKSLKIILSINDDTWSTYSMTREFTSTLGEYLKQFQKLHPTDLEENGMLDAKTIRKIDQDLNEIYFYDTQTASIIHDARTAKYVGVYSAVLEDCELKTKPQDTSPVLTIGGVTESIKMGRAIYIIQVLEGKNWFLVETIGGIMGYLQVSNVWIDSIMPDPTATLVKIPLGPNQKISDLILPHIQKERASVIETDLSREEWKFYALATVRFNNPQGKQTRQNKKLNLNNGRYDIKKVIPSSIFLNNPGDWDPYKAIYGNPGQEKILEKNSTVYQKSWAYYHTHISGWDNVHNVKLKPGGYIWLPSIQYVEGLYKQLKAGAETTSQNTFSILEAQSKFYFGEFKDRLNDTWPVNWGIRMDASIGATFGYPVSVDGSYYYAMWRESETLIKVTRRGTLAAGFDTGAGVGGFIGLTSNKGRHYGEDNNYFGAQAQAGIQFQAGEQILIHQEMVFDIKNDLAVASLLMAALQLEIAVDPLGRLFVTLLKLSGIDPNDYTTMIKAEVAPYLRLRGQAGIGLGFSDNKNFTDYWKNDNKKHDIRKGLALTPFSLLSLFSVQFGIVGSLTFAAGIKISHENFQYDEITGFRLPEKSSLEVYAETEGNVGMTIPIISTFAPFLTNASFGAGAKLVLDFYYAQAEFDNDPSTKEGFKFQKLVLYSKSGDVDIYQRPSHETELEIDVDVSLKKPSSSSPGTVTVNIQNHSVSAMLAGLKFRKLIGVGTILTNPFLGTGISSKSFFSREKSLNTLIKHTDPKGMKTLKDVKNTAKYGINMMALVDIEFKPPLDLLIDFAASLYDQFNSDPDFHINELPVKLLEIINNPTSIPDDYKQKISLIIENSEIPKILLHGEIGATLGAGFYLADLAKIRLRLTAGINLVFHYDIKSALIEMIEKELGMDLKSFLKNLYLSPSSKGEEIVIEPANRPKEQ